MMLRLLKWLAYWDVDGGGWRRVGRLVGIVGTVGIPGISGIVFEMCSDCFVFCF